MEMPLRSGVWLSIVVIGRNEEDHLPGLFRSLPRDKDIEWIYVDSQSDDQSVPIALDHAVRVYQVDETSVYAPGTGRYIGTLEARGDWVLYLDGDMTLRNEFVLFIEKLRAALVRTCAIEQDTNSELTNRSRLPEEVTAFVGRTRNILLNIKDEVIAERDYAVLSPREMGLVDEWGKPASYHGGAVLYRRDMVLKAGNWNPSLYQLEEIDLFSRVRATGGILRAVDLPMADHYTPYLSIRERLLLNFLPQWQGKKLYGAGQVVAARLKEGGLLSFIRIYPYPFIVFSGLFLSPLFFFVWPPLPLLVNLLIALWIGLAKKWYFYLVYLGNLLQIFRGFKHYNRFIPTYKEIKTR
jgi:glycosyltransferase involved in cell wall biosynthesis